MRTLHPESLGPCCLKLIAFLRWTHIHILGWTQPDEGSVGLSNLGRIVPFVVLNFSSWLRNASVE